MELNAKCIATTVNDKDGSLQLKLFSCGMVPLRTGKSYSHTFGRDLLEEIATQTKATDSHGIYIDILSQLLRFDSIN